MEEYKITSHSDNETIAIAQNIESEKFPNMVICLNGDLGSGKTMFTKGFAHAMGIDEITSPTFTIIKEYVGELPLYHMERVVQETQKLFGDGSHIIYVNGSYKNDDDPIGKLMHDFRCTRSVDMFYNELKDTVKHFKETEGGRGQVCKAMEERIKRERSEERIEVLLGTVKSLMENMQLSAQQVMAAMNISEEDKQKLIKKL